ncbi:MAG: RlmE family RNA methyltransferase [Alphaproteobacteria bacterium]|nr:MAG: RlmE family RNA methyltransferase [Alphaproteobacteria bacterium]
MTKKKSTGGRGTRQMHVRVKTAKGRRLSSTKWLQRQLNDPYVIMAQEQGYRSRAAFKLSELDDRFKFIKRGAKVLDLGCAPGGWCQVAVARVGESGRVVGVDLQEVEPIPGAELLQLDFMEEDAENKIETLLGGKVDVVLSDMAAPSTGHKQTDHLRIMALCEAALDFAYEVLEPGGTFCAKVLQGGTEHELLNAMKQRFATVRHAKPKASRSDSSEMYVLATGFKG